MCFVTARVIDLENAVVCAIFVPKRNSIVIQLFLPSLYVDTITVTNVKIEGKQNIRSRYLLLSIYFIYFFILFKFFDVDTS